MTRKVTEVAVGIILNAQNEYLLAKRPVGKPYADYWEFPGGKIEAGESVAQALARELQEELGIEIDGSTEWGVIEHDYPHAYVRLHLRLVRAWAGECSGLEGQELCWQQTREVQECHVSPLLPATIAIIEMLKEKNI